MTTLASSDAPDAVPRRMLFLIDQFVDNTAGTEGQLFRLIEVLSARGCQCHLVVLKRSAFLEQGRLPCSWTVLGHDRLLSPRTWLALYRLGRRFRRQGFGLAQTFFNDMSVLAPPMLAATGIRTIISRRDMGFWYTPAYLAMLRLTRRFVAACAVNSEAVASVTARCERFPLSELAVIYNGLAPPQPVDRPTDLEALKQRGRLICGLVANVRPIKRIGDLLEALARIAASEPALDLVIVGGGDQTPLREQAQGLGISDRVHLLGHRRDITACLAAFDMAALCSESEGFSNAIIEYMQAGLPVIGTEAGGNPEAIDHGRTGYLYPVGDVGALATHLAYLARDPQLRDTLGAQAAEDARQRFSIERMVNDHVALYRRLMPGHLW